MKKLFTLLFCSLFTFNLLATQMTGFAFLASTCDFSQSCAVSNGTGGTQTRTSCAAAFGTCSGFTCNASYTNVGGSCVLSNQTRSCSVANGATTGTQTTTNGGQTWSACSGFTCNTGYAVSGSSCVYSFNVVCMAGGLGACSTVNRFNTSNTVVYNSSFCPDATVTLNFTRKLNCPNIGGSAVTMGTSISGSRTGTCPTSGSFASGESESSTSTVSVYKLNGAFEFAHADRGLEAIGCVNVP